jgi:hypothetical protein
MKDGSIAKAIVQHNSVETLDLLAIELLQFHSSQDWVDMTLNVIEVTLLSLGRGVGLDICPHPVIHVLRYCLGVLGNKAAVLNLSKPLAK